MNRIVVLVALLVLLIGFVLSNITDTGASIADTSVPGNEVANNLSEAEWVDKADTPNSGGYGEAVASIRSNIYIVRCLYASSTPQFWCYNPTTDDWNSLSTSGLPIGAFRIYGSEPDSSAVANAGSNQSVQVGDIVTFSGTGTDADGSIAKYEWDFDGNGIYDWSSGTTDVTGTWSGNWWRSDGGEEGTLTATLTQSGSSLSGNMTITSTTFSYSQDTTVSGSVEGNDVVFGIAIGGNGSTVTIDFEGTVSEDGNQMSGTYSMSTGYTGTWTVTRETPSPVPTLDQSQTSTPGNTGLEGDWWLSQGFIPSMSVLTSVEVYVGSPFADLSYPLTLQVRGDSNGLPSGSVLATTSVTMTKKAWEWIAFDLPDLSVNPGTRYHLVLRSITNYHVGLDSTNPYPHGCMGYSTDAGATWKYGGYVENCDMAFRTYGLAEGDILAHYRGYSGDSSAVDTPDLLKAINDWADGIIPSGFTQAITTLQLLQLIGEWAGGA